ncbi:MAG: ribosomal protein S18 acetylase RimI-like enzyme [Bacteroidia bacterium]|jgi:ribosomal protein S18 acetylase RimI-like enzyme
MKIEQYHQQITKELLALLLAADPDEEVVFSYVSDAEILVAYEKDLLVGVAVLTKSDGYFELKNLAVAAAFQGQGIAKLLIAELKVLAKRMGAHFVEVGTGNSSLSQLALYQKCGFRMRSVEQNYFAPYPQPIFENGIRCIDMVRLRADL